MKKLLSAICLSLFFFGFTNNARATHLAGAEITYQYIGNGSNHLYEVTLIIYRATTNKGGGGSTAGIFGSQSLCISSSCFGSQNVTMPRVPPPPGQSSVGQGIPGASAGGWVTPKISACAPTSDPQFVFIEMHVFNTQVTLPGTCNDFKFSWNSGARNNAINNLQSPGSQNLYIDALLNNNFGPNSSPEFLNPAAKAFCINQPFVWSQAASEVDGDSLLYKFDRPLDGFGCPGTPSPIPYQSPYTLQNPMSTTSGIQIDAALGTFKFEPNNPEVVAIKVTVDEYRYDPNFGVHIKIGYVSRDLQVIIATACKAATANGPQIDLTAQGNSTTQLSADSLSNFDIGVNVSNDYTVVGGDTLYDIPVVSYNCFDSAVALDFDVDVVCESIEDNGTDFRIIGPDAEPRPVIGVKKNCQTDLTTSSIELLLYKALDLNGDYLLYVKTGDDGNTIENECGFPLPPMFAIIIRVDNCPILDYTLKNVSVEADQHGRVEWEIVDSTYNKNLFNGWQILRSNDYATFWPLDTLYEDANARSYTDTTLDGYMVDNSQYQYAVQLIQNGNAKAPTNTITSILLGGVHHPDQGIMEYSWNAYDGWLDPEYEVEFGTLNDLTGVIDWENHLGPQANLNTFNYTIPEASESTEGVYAFRVMATDPADPLGTYFSESNWVYLEVTWEEPEIPNEPYVPNVFTPNGDGANDRFYVDSEYSHISISVYNRWGKLVYEDLDAPKEKYLPASGKGWDGRDINTGNLLADGTYYYMIYLKDEPTGETRDFKGHLSIFTAGAK